MIRKSWHILPRRASELRWILVNVRTRCIVRIAVMTLDEARRALEHPSYLSHPLRWYPEVSAIEAMKFVPSLPAPDSPADLYIP